jgi:hypothetical protein
VKRFITVAIVAALIMSAAVPLFAKGKSTSGCTRYCVRTGNGRQQMLGGKSGESSQKGLKNAAAHSRSVTPADKVPK